MSEVLNRIEDKAKKAKKKIGQIPDTQKVVHRDREEEPYLDSCIYHSPNRY